MKASGSFVVNPYSCHLVQTCSINSKEMG